MVLFAVEMVDWLVTGVPTVVAVVVEELLGDRAASDNERIGINFGDTTTTITTTTTTTTTTTSLDVFNNATGLMAKISMPSISFSTVFSLATNGQAHSCTLVLSVPGTGIPADLMGNPYY
ncbi:hypothetical protein M0804_012084 [Polistes exclamans]|nr:hypothetical protein M0804_012084 [Polistes exclamans]